MLLSTCTAADRTARRLLGARPASEARKSRHAALLLPLAIGTLLVACGGGDTPTPPPVIPPTPPVEPARATTVRMVAPATLALGDTAVVTLEVLDQRGQPMTSFTSEQGPRLTVSNPGGVPAARLVAVPEVAAPDYAGTWPGPFHRIEALGPGTARLVARFPGLPDATADLTVTGTPVARIVLTLPDTLVRGIPQPLGIRLEDASGTALTDRQPLVTFVSGAASLVRTGDTREIRPTDVGMGMLTVQSGAVSVTRGTPIRAAGIRRIRIEEATASLTAGQSTTIRLVNAEDSAGLAPYGGMPRLAWSLAGQGALAVGDGDSTATVTHTADGIARVRAVVAADVNGAGIGDSLEVDLLPERTFGIDIVYPDTTIQDPFQDVRFRTFRADTVFRRWVREAVADVERYIVSMGPPLDVNIVGNPNCWADHIRPQTTRYSFVVLEAEGTGIAVSRAGGGGACALRPHSRTPVAGRMYFTTNVIEMFLRDFGYTRNTEAWAKFIVQHELFHALGIGGAWRSNGLETWVRTSTPPVYAPLLARSSGTLEFVRNGGDTRWNGIPLDAGGAHFSNTIGDIMMRELSGTRQTITRMLLGVLADFGYAVDRSLAAPFTFAPFAPPTSALVAASRPSFTLFGAGTGVSETTGAWCGVGHERTGAGHRH